LLRRLSPVLPIAYSQTLPLSMASALFTPEQEEIIYRNPINKIVDRYYDSLPDDLSSFDQDIDEGT
jgi:hypothetical protein